VRPYLWVVHLALIATGAYFLADISNFFIADRLHTSMGVRPKLQTSVSGSPELAFASLRGVSYSSIVQKNIFDPTMGIFIPPPPPTIVPKPVFVPPPVFIPPPVVVPKIPLNVRLIGTVIRIDNPSYAVIQDNRTSKQLIYRVGDFLLEDAKIILIERNKVVISRGEDEKVVLEISLSGVASSRSEVSPGRTPPPPVPQPVAVPAPMRAPAGGVRQIGEARWLMDRSEVDYAVAHLPELLTKARVVPNFTDGQADGFRIFAIQEDSVYAKIGLQNGDILKRVNQIDVRNPQNFLQVFQQLKDEASITIDLVRNSEEKTFDYTIR
jgi:general secretion pathway protein C